MILPRDKKQQHYRQHRHDSINSSTKCAFFICFFIAAINYQLSLVSTHTTQWQQTTSYGTLYFSFYDFYHVMRSFHEYLIMIIIMVIIIIIIIKYIGFGSAHSRNHSTALTTKFIKLH